MILPGTYANGFAPRDGEPLFPELWRGCVGAWNPGLGPSGAVLRDWSVFHDDATLSSPSSAFAPVGSKWSLSSGHATVASKTRLEAVSSVSLWLSITATSGFSVAVSRDTNTNPNRAWYIARTNQAIDVAVWNNSGTLRTLTSASVLSTGRWFHVAITWDGVMLDLYIDGKKSTGDTLSGTPRSVTADLKINAFANNTFVWSGSTDDVRVYDRPIARIIPILASRRGIAYELAPRKRTYSIPAAPGGFQPYWATQRSQMIGGGVR